MRCVGELRLLDRGCDDVSYKLYVCVFESTPLHGLNGIKLDVLPAVQAQCRYCRHDSRAFS